VRPAGISPASLRSSVPRTQAGSLPLPAARYRVVYYRGGIRGGRGREAVGPAAIDRRLVRRTRLLPSNRGAVGVSGATGRSGGRACARLSSPLAMGAARAAGGFAMAAAHGEVRPLTRDSHHWRGAGIGSQSAAVGILPGHEPSRRCFAPRRTFLPTMAIVVGAARTMLFVAAEHPEETPRRLATPRGRGKRARAPDWARRRAAGP
jgi:hypothetical protein